MRCFIAIDLPDRIKEFIGGLIKFSTSLEGVNIVQPKNYHITIKFLGEIFENFLLELKVLLRSIAKEFSPFELFITAPGVFPDQRNPRVVWIGTDNSSDLKRLVKRVDEELKKFGFDSQQKDFKSHITLARVKNIKYGRYFYEKVIKNYQTATQNIDSDLLRFQVEEFVLMKSTLTAAGSIYDVLESFSLSKK